MSIEDYFLFDDCHWVPCPGGGELGLVSAREHGFQDFLIRNKIEDIDKLTKEDFLQCIPGVLLVDWRGITDQEGNEIPYSIEKAGEFCGKSRKFCETILAEVANLSSEEDASKKKS